MGIDGERLKQLRLSRGLTPARMADIIGISRQGYNTYESGKIKAPRKLEALAKFFNVSSLSLSFQLHIFRVIFTANAYLYYHIYHENNTLH